jgi:hypothetical protein
MLTFQRSLFEAMTTIIKLLDIFLKIFLLYCLGADVPSNNKMTSSGTSLLTSLTMVSINFSFKKII